MTQNAQAGFQAPPSSNNVKNVISSQPRTLYLNKPKHYAEEEDVSGAPAPSLDDTQGEGNPSNLEPNHDWQKRYSDLKSYHDKQILLKDANLAETARLLAEKEKALETAKAIPVKLPSTTEEINSFRAKYPDLFNTIKTIAMEENLTTKVQLEKAIDEANKRSKQLVAEKAKNELLSIHPDADTLKSDPEFISWFEEQIPVIKSLLTSDFVKDVARGLDIYKKDKGLIRETEEQKRVKQAAAAMVVPTNNIIEVGSNGGKIWRASEVKKIPTSQYHKYEAEINKALMEGRYDENS